MNYTTPAFALLVASAALLVPMDAGASNTFVFPGSMCTPETASTGTPAISIDGSIYNSSSVNDLQVVCPLLRNDSQSAVSDTRVRVNDNNSLKTLECTLRCRDDDTAAVQTEPLDTGAASTQGNYIELDYASMSGYSFGACYLRCILPNVNAAASYVVSYQATFL